MYRGLTASLLLHLSVLAWALLSFQMTPHLDLPDVQPISVSIIQPSDVTRIKEGDPDAKELEAKAKDEPKPEQFKKEAPKPKPVTAPPPAAEPPPPPPEPPKPEPVKEEPKPDPIADKIAALPPPKPEPAPGPTPEEKKALDEKIEQDRLAEEQKKAEEQRKLEEQRKKEEERKKAEDKKRKEEDKKKKEQEKKLADARKKAEEAKKKQFDADRIAALIDKSPDKKGGPTGATPPTKPTTHTGPTAGERGGKDSVLSAREQDMLAGMLKAQIAPCWRLPGAGGGTENPVVTLRWRLKPDGTLDGEPQIARAASGPLGGLANEAAIRAVKGCAPFKLPAEHYASWKEVIWEFDPSKML